MHLRKSTQWVFLPFEGPFFVPVLGSTMAFATGGSEAIKFPLLVIDKMVQKYGEVMRLSMGSQHTIFISGEK